MGEEEKKPEEKKMEEEKPEEVKKEGEKKPEAAKEKKEEKKAEEGKDGKVEAKEGEDATAAPPPPPPPQEIVLKVYMHCEGCARKVKRCLKGFQGVEDVSTDCKTHKVVVKGEKADPIKVLERVQRKSHRQVELLSPIPKQPTEEEKKAEEKEKPKPEEKKQEPQVITVVLKVHMHCDACAQEIKKRILRIKGVESAEADLKSSEVTVKGVFDPPKLVDYVHKRTGKHAAIVKQEPEKKEKEKAKDEKKGGEVGDKDKKGKDGGGDEAKAEENKENKGDNNEAAAAAAGGAPEGAAAEETKVVELMKKNENYSYPPRYAMEQYAYPPQIMEQYANPPQIMGQYAYPPQIFSDENPNACSIM